MQLEPGQAEPKILQLAEAMRTRLNVLESLLCSAVKRDRPEEKCEGEGRPIIPNIVDEILRLMQYNNKRIEDLTKVLEADIISKLGK